MERIEPSWPTAARFWLDCCPTTSCSVELGEERAAELGRRYANAFPDGYRADFPPRTAVADPQADRGAERRGRLPCSTSTSRSARATTSAASRSTGSAARSR
ncbi:hypothetical protein [Kitasatospora albolonga]|uniref:hypothetical protein n=1 Tax=Kitasatospora albolonga TaxID=68173 RepID=UPI003CD0AD14